MRQWRKDAPIRVYQCKQDCCVVRVPGRRFWFVRTPKGRETFSSFRDATTYAAYMAGTVQESPIVYPSHGPAKGHAYDPTGESS